MGTAVLPATVSPVGAPVLAAVRGAKAQGASHVVALANLGRDNTTVSVSGGVGCVLYMLAPVAGDLTSSDVTLNGVLLSASVDGTLPSLEGHRVSCSAVHLRAGAVAFVVAVAEGPSGSR